MVGKIDTVKMHLIILTHERPSYFKKMMEALISNTKWKLNIIVVDNNSKSKELKDYLHYIYNKGYVDELILRNENDYINGFYKGIEKIKEPRDFLISDSDIEVPNLNPCWLEQLYKLFKKYNMDRLGIGLHDTVFNPENVGKSDEVIFQNWGCALQIIKWKFWKYSEMFESSHPSRFQKRLMDAKGKCGFVNNLKAIHLGENERENNFEYFRDKRRKFYGEKI